MALADSRGASEPDEFVEREAGVLRARPGLGVKLDTELRLPLGADPLVRPVVDVDEPRFPIVGKRPIIDGIAVILARHEAAPREQVLHRLVDAAMTVGQLVRRAAGGKGQDLVAEADAEDRLFRFAPELP